MKGLESFYTIGHSQWEETAMQQGPTDLVDILLLIFSLVIGGIAVGGASHAWRSWSNYRRIQRHLDRR